MKLNILKVLSILSFVILMDNSPYVYAITQVLLLTLCTHRLINNRIIERSRAIWSLGLIIIFLADIIIAQKLPSISTSLKILNFSLICLVARHDDAFLIIKSIRYLLYLNFFVALFVFTGLLPQFFSLKIYENIRLLGAPINAGIIFEANYSAIVVGLCVFLPGNKFFNHFVALCSMTLFTFRSGYMASILSIFAQFNRKYLIHMILLSWVLLLFVLYKFTGPIGLEQRYFIWSAFFENYSAGMIYSNSEVQEFLKIGMTASPWGESGLNLHSGIFESLVFKGVLSTLIAGLAIFLASFNSSIIKLALLFYLIVIATVFSLSLGGLNTISLCLSFLVAGNLVKLRS